MHKQQGFTLIELVVVIVILGILAATALPRFIDLSVDAHNSAARGVAGALSSWSATNYGARLAGSASATTLSAADVCSVGAANAIPANAVTGVTLQTTAPGNDTQFQIGGTGDCSGTAATVTCTVTPNGTGVTAQNATVFCAR